MAASSGVRGQGRRLLIEAALRLSTRTRSILALGLREVAREAGLNPNSFYRHFSSLEDLGLDLVEDVARELRQPLRDLRRQAAQAVAAEPAVEGADSQVSLRFKQSDRVARETVALFFEYVGNHREVFILAAGEMHGASPVLRKAIRQLMDALAEDIVADVRELELLPMLDDAPLQELAPVIVRQLFLLALDYLEQPERLEACKAQAHTLIMTLLAGTAALRAQDPAARALLEAAIAQR